MAKAAVAETRDTETPPQAARGPGGRGHLGETSWSKDDWLKALEKIATISGACKEIGIARATAYRARKADAEFAARWDEVEEAAIDEVEKVALERAVKGSDRLIEFLLRHKRPEIYRDRIAIEDERRRAEREEMAKLSDEELEEQLVELPDNVTMIDAARNGGTRRR